MGTLIYFAYGSNMSSARLRARLPGVRPRGTAALPGHELRFHKRGSDGSAKLDAVRSASATASVTGVLYALDAGQKTRLDAIEGAGYACVTVLVNAPDGAWVEAFMYQAVDVDPSLRPFDWYVAHVLAGAREAGLAEAQIAALAATEHIEDPDPARARREAAIHAPPTDRR